MTRPGSPDPVGSAPPLSSRESAAPSTAPRSPEPVDPSATYQGRGERFAAERDRFTERALWISHARIATFLAAAIFLIAGAASSPPVSAPLVTAGALFLTAFVVLIFAHARARQQRRWYEMLRALNDEATARLRRDWDALPAPEPATRYGAAAAHPYAADLDLFGRASLFQLAGTTATVPGRSTLARWLLAPATPQSIVRRQGAVAELAPMLDLRDELAAHGRLSGHIEPAALEDFLRWAEGRPWLLGRPWLVWLTRLLPVLTIALIILDAAGWTGYAFWVLPIALALLLTRTVRGSVQSTFAGAGAGEADLRRYAAAFALIAGTPFRATCLARIQDDLSAEGAPAHRRIGRLARLLHLSDVRHSMLYFPIQVLTLWDFHVVYALEQWQRSAGRHVRGWFSALGQAEALCALASLAHAHPAWAFPEMMSPSTHSNEAASSTDDQAPSGRRRPPGGQAIPDHPAPATQQTPSHDQPPPDDRTPGNDQSSATPWAQSDQALANDQPPSEDRTPPREQAPSDDGVPPNHQAQRRDQAPILEATALAHPLLPTGMAVPNDVVVGPPGSFLLITGSNMSGKSTLLRAIGSNVVLAQAGGPVCAARLRMPSLAPYTSMRIQDSLEQGLSQFMAELRRVKDVVDAARQARARGGPTLLYLLDELLRGTNTVERQVASRRILRHLLENGAIGAITTHDLDLASDDGLAAAARPVHFRETVEAGPEGPVLSFDYELRPGLAVSTNALTLLDIVGLKD